MTDEQKKFIQETTTIIYEECNRLQWVVKGIASVQSHPDELRATLSLDGFRTIANNLTDMLRQHEHANRSPYTPIGHRNELPKP